MVQEVRELGHEAAEGNEVTDLGEFYGSCLVLGAGTCPVQRVKWADSEEHRALLRNNLDDNFKEVFRVDRVATTPKVNLVWDLEKFPWPVPQNYFDQVHAYEVLEHLGAMGDFVSFFDTWKEIWKALRPNGIFCGTTPGWNSIWAWSDPGHRRVYSQDLLFYLSQRSYEEQLRKTAMTDYREWFPPPFHFDINKYIYTNPEDLNCSGFAFVLQKGFWVPGEGIDYSR